MRIIYTLALFTFIISTAITQAWANEKDAMVLLPIQGKGINAQEKDILRAVLQEGLSRSYKVYSGAEVDKKLQKFIKKSCDTQKCLQEVAINFQGELVGRGIILPSGGDYLVTLEIKNVFTDDVVESKTESCSRCNLSGVIDLLKNMTRIQTVNTINGGAVDLVTTALDGQEDTAEFAMLIMESEPTGADIRINGKVVGKTPYQNFDLKVGQKLKLRLSKTGYSSKNLEFTIKPGANELLNLTLSKAIGKIIVTTAPYERGAKIYLDNSKQVIGRVPAQLKLPDGEHILRVVGAKMAGQKKIIVKGDERINVTIALNAGSFFDKLKDGSNGPEMVVIPAGSFRMGDIQGAGDSDEKPVHRVSIKKAFALGKTEVTFAQYDKYANATGKTKPKDGGWGRGNRPVIYVSWDDAVAYARWLSQQTGKKYRLPSESEWEYTARAGSETKYPWGNGLGTNNANCRGCGSQWDGSKTAPVGSFSANGFGLLDMQGNVWEWTQDCYKSDYSAALSDGRAVLTGTCAKRVLRGGSWSDGPRTIRSANRFRFPADFRSNDIGFRLAQDI